jgi:hypothetical protein
MMRGTNHCEKEATSEQNCINLVKTRLYVHYFVFFAVIATGVAIAGGYLFLAHGFAVSAKGAQRT